MLDHQMLRKLRSASRLIGKAIAVDVADLADDEHIEVDELLSEIISDSIRIRPGSTTRCTSDRG